MKKLALLSLPLLATLVLSSTGLADSPYPIRTKAERDALTPAQVLQSLKEGNQRFVSGAQKPRDFRQEQMATKGGQHPAAVLLSCMDSRAPVEIVFDKGIGEVFNTRVAGNVANPDILGSMEYGCAAAGAKLVLVLGHTRCGAVNGAIDNVEMGNLTGLLERIHPAVEAVHNEHPDWEVKSSNGPLEEAVTRKNVQLTVEKVRRLSPILRKMEEKGEILIQGGIYDVSSGKVEFL